MLDFTQLSDPNGGNYHLVFEQQTFIFQLHLEVYPYFAPKTKLTRWRVHLSLILLIVKHSVSLEIKTESKRVLKMIYRTIT